VTERPYPIDGGDIGIVNGECKCGKEGKKEENNFEYLDLLGV